jgi:tRNA dimethylallyltransferase
MKSNKTIVILGPTASGKTGLAIDLAVKYNGEIISADSRQVYKGMDIGSGKDLPDYHLELPLSRFTALKKRGIDVVKKGGKAIVDVPYHLIDVVKPNTEFSLGKFYKKAQIAIKNIRKKNRLPIVAGGTGLWLQALVDGYNLSSVKADKELRARLEKLSVKQVFAELKTINKKFAEKLNNSEKNNKRRLIRYIEIIKTEGKIPEKKESKNNENDDFLLIGLSWPKETLHKRIKMRLMQRLEEEDMMGEVERLHQEGVSWDRLESFGLEYKYLAMHLQDKIEYDDMIEQLFIATRQFAKRQMSWFKRWEKQGAKIHWVENKKEAEKLVKDFLTS